MSRVVLAWTTLVLLAHCAPTSAQQSSLLRNTNFEFEQSSAKSQNEIELQQYEVEPHTPAAPSQNWFFCPPDFLNGQNPFSATVELNQDVFFGTHFILTGYYAMTEDKDFTFYSILWNTPDFSFLGGGQGLWTEFGAGVNYKYFDGNVTVNPQLGFLNGTLLSGAARPLVFEGVVPNITANLNTTFTEGEFYMGYYIAARSPRANDFLHWWITAGVKPWGDSDCWERIISTGVHFEQLRLTRSQTASATDVYLWLGPYVQFALPNNVSLRFSGGWDVSRTGNPDFYKVNITYAF